MCMLFIGLDRLNKRCVVPIEVGLVLWIEREIEWIEVLIFRRRQRWGEGGERKQQLGMRL